MISRGDAEARRGRVASSWTIVAQAISGRFDIQERRPYGFPRNHLASLPLRSSVPSAVKTDSTTEATEGRGGLQRFVHRGEAGIGTRGAGRAGISGIGDREERDQEAGREILLLPGGGE